MIVVAQKRKEAIPDAWNCLFCFTVCLRSRFTSFSGTRKITITHKKRFVSDFGGSPNGNLLHPVKDFVLTKLELDS